jgi:signal transduction histidine kinase
MATILIVDDEPINVEIVRVHLEPLEHEVLGVGSGEAAMQVFSAVAPDLVLMDVRMPGMSGIEAMVELKERARPEFLPVVLMTGLDDDETRRQGFQAGADEFVPKPLDAGLLKLRVTNLLGQRADRAALAKRNARLAELQAFRDEMTALLVHDLKNPAAIVLNNIDYARACVTAERDVAIAEALDDALAGCRRLIRLIGDLLDVARADDERLGIRRASIVICDLLMPIVQLRVLAARHHHVELRAEVPHDLVADVDPDFLSRMVENLLDNALHHTPAYGTILVTATQTAGALQVRVANTGTPIPPEQRRAIFDKYRQVDAERGSRLRRGLGLYFCRIAAEAHGGTILVEEARDFPVQFVISLPSEGAQHHHEARRVAATGSRM